MTEQHAHKWLILLAVGSALLMGTIDGSIVNVALPSLTIGLHTQFHVVQWAVLSFLMGLAVLTLMAGRLGDMIGKKRGRALHCLQPGRSDAHGRERAVGKRHGGVVDPR